MEEENRRARNECKICGKRFKCGRSLGGHMRSHLISFSSSDHRKTGNQLLGNGANEERKQCGRSSHLMFGHKEEDSLLSSTEQVIDSHSENKSTSPLCRRKRSNRGKGYETSTNSSSDLTVAISNDQLEEEEGVALSLLLLSNNQYGVDARVDSSGKYFQSNSAQVNTVQVLAKESISEDEHPEVPIANSSHETLIKKPLRKQNLRHFIDSFNISSNTSEYAPNSEKKGKFLCVFCLKAFPTCQALGGHRASHMRFNGSCSIRNQTSTELKKSATYNRRVDSTECMETWKKNKEHECPICFAVFASGQALGGHKRFHSTIDKTRLTADPSVFDVSKPIRHFLDLNMPGPAEEETTQVKEMAYKGYQNT